jgi:hypothetical protein
MIDIKYNEKDVKRFWSHVNIKNENECWEWTGYKDKKGYGRININSKMIGTHRFSYLIYNKIIPDGMLILHSCNNPSCVNPTHLRAGTNKDNAQDSLLAGTSRSLHQNGEKNTSSKITENQAIKIIELYNSGVLLKDISEMFNIQVPAIQRIATGKRWSHIKNNPNKGRMYKLREEGENIRKLYATGQYTYKTLGNLYNVSDEEIRLVVTNQRRKSL